MTNNYEESFDQAKSVDNASTKSSIKNPTINDKTAKIQNVHFVRSREPIPEVISDSVRLKHQQSRKTFPELNLSEGEYVIMNIKRHSIGLIIPTILGFFLIFFSLVVFVNVDLLTGPVKVNSVSLSSSDLVLPLFLFAGLILLANYVIFYVYSKNQLFLTNESLIQHIQISLFSKKERVISLMDIEDISFSQHGLIQTVFNFGSMRLSTEGEGSTYSFDYTPDPKETVSNLSDAIESFKYGRAINQDKR